MPLEVLLPKASLNGEDDVELLRIETESEVALSLNAKTTTSFSITYMGCYWYLEYDGSSEYDESVDETVNLQTGIWNLIRDPELRREPDKYTFGASAPFWRFDIIGNLASYEQDLKTAIKLIALDFANWATDRRAMHRRKPRGK